MIRAPLMCQKELTQTLSSSELFGLSAETGRGPNVFYSRRPARFIGLSGSCKTRPHIARGRGRIPAPGQFNSQIAPFSAKANATQAA